MSLLSMKSRACPRDEVRSWGLLYYSSDQKVTPDKYWTNFGKVIYDNSKDEMKVNDEVRKKAAEIVGDASTPDEKLKRIYDFAKSRSKTSSGTKLCRQMKVEVQGKQITVRYAQTRRRYGGNIDNLFGALSTAAGSKRGWQFPAIDRTFSGSGIHESLFPRLVLCGRESK